MDNYQVALTALADTTRRTVLELLKHGPLTVAELAEKVTVSRPAVSQHLKVLSDARLVAHEAQGTRHLYHVEPAGLAALREYLEQMWGDMLRAYADSAADVSDAPRKTVRRARGTQQ